MKSNIFAVLFMALSVAALVLIFIARGRADDLPPEFRFEALDMVYDSETTETDLLQGIQAFDQVDGDVTSRIVVEKVVISKEDQAAVVYYAVSDMSGNVAKQSRVFPANSGDLNSNGTRVGEIDDSSSMQAPNMPDHDSDGAVMQSSEAGSMSSTDSAQ